MAPPRPEAVRRRRRVGERAARAVRDALRASADTEDLAGARLVRVAGGSSNFAWSARDRAGERRYVRLASSATSTLGADLVNECRVLALVSRAAIGPRVLRCDPLRLLLVTEWIETAPAGDPADPARLHAVGASLARLHAMTPPPGLKRVDFGEQVRALRTAAGHDAACETLAARAGVVLASLAERAERDSLCHNDLNPGNVLLDRSGRAWFVDWEYAGLGDPAYDLASCASQHALDRGATAALLHGYRAHGGRADAGRVALARWVFDYVQALWYRALAATAAPDAPLDRAEALERAVRLENSLRDRASGAARGDNAAFGS